MMLVRHLLSPPQSPIQTGAGAYDGRLFGVSAVGSATAPSVVGRHLRPMNRTLRTTYGTFFGANRARVDVWWVTVWTVPLHVEASFGQTQRRRLNRTAAVTGKPTPPCTESSSVGSAGMPGRRTTSKSNSVKECHTKPSVVLRGTWPARSSISSKHQPPGPPKTSPKWRLYKTFMEAAPVGLSASH